MTTKISIRKSVTASKALKDVFKSTFGEFIKDIRETDELSQTELAERMHVSRQFIREFSHHEN